MKRCSLLLALLGASVFGQQPQPLSVGIVLDTSGSMARKLPQARQIIGEILKSAGAEDEFAVIQSADRPVAAGGFVNASGALDSIAFAQAKGSSALLDAVYLGTQFMKMARHGRKVLLVISDGVDNSSRYTYADIATALAQSGVLVHTIALNQPATPEVLRRLAERAGGRHFGVADVAQVSQTVSDLKVAMRSQP